MCGGGIQNRNRTSEEDSASEERSNCGHVELKGVFENCPSKRTTEVVVNQPFMSTKHCKMQLGRDVVQLIECQPTLDLCGYLKLNKVPHFHFTWALKIM